MQQLHVFYAGRVQGVGFRATVHDIAARLKLTGWVRNRRDGRVEVLAFGEPGVLQAFLNEVSASYVGANVRDCQLSWSDTTEEHQGFRVRETV